MRTTFSRLLTAAALANPRVLLLTGDHGYALFDEFRRECPGQYINCGIAEQNMVGVAAGLAKGGFRPIVYGLSAFVPMRVLEQIKIDICYESLPVIFIGDGAGVVYAQLGTSHQCTEDIAALRPLPNLAIVSPADRFELEYCFDYLLVRDSAGYLRFGKADLGDLHATVPEAPIGDLLPLRTGRKPYAFIATGSMASVAAKIADEIGDVPVWTVPTLKPFNTRQLVALTAGLTHVFVMEEHAAQGGLGGLVSEVLSETGTCRVTRFGTEKFSELCGTYGFLMEYHGLAAAQLQARILATVA
jgi:transketolase